MATFHNCWPSRVRTSRNQASQGDFSIFSKSLSTHLVRTKKVTKVTQEKPVKLHQRVTF